ncbi:SLAF5 protein, partial [Alectura lathami]|nr:SLAF5 protein [Alectura lathami]
GQREMFWCLLLACLLQQAKPGLSRVFSPACDSNDVAGIEGKCVTFHLRYLKGEKLAWSSSRGTILTFQSGKSIDFFDSSLQSRVNVSENGSSLTICQLRSSDAGTYVANFNEFKEEFTLHVYSELRVPEVSCVCRNVSAENCSYVLRCSVEPPGDNSFFWSHHDQQVTKAPELVLEELPLEDPYTCTVQNPVSSRNTTVTPAALCA